MFFNKYKEIALASSDAGAGGGKLSPQMALLGGMLSGCFSTCLNNPFDMVKTRMQVPPLLVFLLPRQLCCCVTFV